MSIVRFGELLRAAREKAGLTKFQAASLIPCTIATIDRWETTDRLPHRSMLVSVAYHYKTDEKALMTAREAAHFEQKREKKKAAT